MVRSLIVWGAGTGDQVERTARQIRQLLEQSKKPQSVGVLELCGETADKMLGALRANTNATHISQLEKWLCSHVDGTDLAGISRTVLELGARHDVTVLIVPSQVATEFPKHFVEHHLPKRAKVRHADWSSAVGPGEAVALMLA